MIWTLHKGNTVQLWHIMSCFSKRFLSLCIYAGIHHVCAGLPAEATEGTKSSELELYIRSWKPPTWCWDLNQGPLERPPELLTLSSESSPKTSHLLYTHLWMTEITKTWERLVREEGNKERREGGKRKEEGRERKRQGQRDRKRQPWHL